MIFLLYKLIVVHFLLDFPLQGDFLARAKNHTAPIDGVPWQVALAAHAIIQGGGVYFVTDRFDLAVLETLLHAFIDYQKSERDSRLGDDTRYLVIKRFNFAADQVLHVLCKVLWVVAYVWV